MTSVAVRQCIDSRESKGYANFCGDRATVRVVIIVAVDWVRYGGGEMANHGLFFVLMRSSQKNPNKQEAKSGSSIDCMV